MTSTAGHNRPIQGNHQHATFEEEVRTQSWDTRRHVEPAPRVPIELILQYVRCHLEGLRARVEELPRCPSRRRPRKKSQLLLGVQASSEKEEQASGLQSSLYPPCAHDNAPRSLLLRHKLLLLLLWMMLIGRLLHGRARSSVFVQQESFECHRRWPD